MKTRRSIKRPSRSRHVVALVLLAQLATSSHEVTADWGYSAYPGSQRPTPRLRIGNAEPGAVARARPQYPADARQKNIQGTVIVEIVITEFGDVAWARAITGPSELHAAAESAACAYKFRPFLRDGQGAVTVGTLSFKFVLPRRYRRPAARPN
jgi:TonB family protein